MTLEDIANKPDRLKALQAMRERRQFKLNHLEGQLRELNVWINNVRHELGDLDGEISTLRAAL